MWVEASRNKNTCVMLYSLVRDFHLHWLFWFAPHNIFMVGGTGDTIFILQVKISVLRELSDLPKVSQLACEVAEQTLPQALWHQTPCQHSTGSWCRARRWGWACIRGQGQVLMTSVESREKFKTLTLPRKYNVLLLFFNHLKPFKRHKRKQAQAYDQENGAA